MASDLAPKVSSFLETDSITKAGSLAILHISRELLQPITLQLSKGRHDGYAEGVVVNTRFGSFPHSTLIGVPWGSQIRASQVDTGSRGRKRKRSALDEDGREGAQDDEVGVDALNDDGPSSVKEAVAASSGFAHILPPTPETWTMSLPHRTQVVYTPDYSYILHRIRARPGSIVIEAGAGSGSFTHAASRAVYNGSSNGSKSKGKVFSYEFHEQRYEKMKEELESHALDNLVRLTRRDVYNGGFLVDDKSPEADAVFLDLPAPWQALAHLSRRKPIDGQESESALPREQSEWLSPLNPKRSVYLCTFSPCIEQVMRTVSAMRRLGWVDIDMVEIANRRLHTARDRIGLTYPPNTKGINHAPRDVEDALLKLTEIEDRYREDAKRKPSDEAVMPIKVESPTEADANSSAQCDVPPDANQRVLKPWMDGRLVSRGEPEVKSHTSYLVFAVLPREWTAEDEAGAAARWPCGNEQSVIGSIDKATKKKLRREQFQKPSERKTRRRERDEKIAEGAELNYSAPVHDA